AEDGIRDLTVTGVQTCALPIYHPGPCRSRWAHPHLGLTGACSTPWRGGNMHVPPRGESGREGRRAVRQNRSPPFRVFRTQSFRRSEERRVGKECSALWSPHDEQ